MINTFKLSKTLRLSLRTALRAYAVPNDSSPDSATVATRSDDGGVIALLHDTRRSLSTHLPDETGGCARIHSPQDSIRVEDCHICVDAIHREKAAGCGITIPTALADMARALMSWCLV